MSHVSKIVSLAVTVLVFAGGIALAVPPSMVPKSQQLKPLPKPFWFVLPTENAQIPAKTAFRVKLKATNPPPPGIYLLWQWKVSGNWQDLGGPPTGASWGGTSLEKVITVPKGSFQQPGYYRVRATWDWKTYSYWRNFQIIPTATLPPIPLPLPGK